MTHRQLKTGYFVLEGINSFAAGYYYNFLFFFLSARFGFSAATNLWISALNGFVYMCLAWWGGKFAQRFGGFASLRLGFSIMAVVMVCGSQVNVGWGHCLIMVFWTSGMCFTWPALEALASEDESSAGLQRMIGIYNVTWAGTSALSFFLGGALINRLGMQSLFWVPLGLHLVQLVLLHWLRRGSVRLHLCQQLAEEAVVPPHQACGGERQFAPSEPAEDSPHGPAFLRMALVANPFAYMAINTLIAVMPDLAQRLNLSLEMAGVFCSVYLFARLLAFWLFWLWSGWHYRFRWLLAAFIFMVASFLAILLVPKLAVVMVAQVFFGLAVGLIYYSSLYYSMHVGETKSEHGGFHESAIGSGIFAGPALGASAQHFFPNHPGSSAWAVSGLLLIGLAAIVVIRVRDARS